MRKGQWEYKFFNSLYTENETFTGNRGETVSSSGRTTFFTSLNQFLYGINERLNIGGELWWRASRFEDGSENSPLSVLNIDGSSSSNHGVTAFGPKVKFQPFGKINRFSVQSGIYFPLKTDLEGMESGKAFLAIDRHYLWLTDFYFDQPIGDKWQVFSRLSFWYFRVRESFRENNFVETPISLFLSYFPTQRLTFYVQGEYWPTHYDDNAEEFSAFERYFFQAGLGGKYQIIPGLMEGEILYTNFLAGSQGVGAGQTFNIGLRFIH